mmetsp:Transcript_5343/g.10219  ORF Transcript_5343/g.10219 Transcript_5343/m.10219 type:complete len:228 (+) Transcript_5343:20-703(+)
MFSYGVQLPTLLDCFLCSTNPTPLRCAMTSNLARLSRPLLSLSLTASGEHAILLRCAKPRQKSVEPRQRLGSCRTVERQHRTVSPHPGSSRLPAGKSMRLAVGVNQRNQHVFTPLHLPGVHAGAVLEAPCDIQNAMAAAEHLELQLVLPDRALRDIVQIREVHVLTLHSLLLCQPQCVEQLPRLHALTVQRPVAGVSQLVELHHVHRVIPVVAKTNQVHASWVVLRL